MDRRSFTNSKLNYISFQLQDDAVSDIQTAFDGEYVVVLSNKRAATEINGVINIYHIASRKQIYRLEVLKSDSKKQVVKIAISTNGKYVAAFIGEQIMLIDTHAKKQIYNTTYTKSDAPVALLVTNKGRINIGFIDRVVTLNPFAEDKKRYRLYKAQMGISGLVHSPDDATFAILECETKKSDIEVKEKGLICIFTPKDRHQLIQPVDKQIFAKYMEDDWFAGGQKEVIIYLKDFRYRSFVFTPGEQHGWAYLTRDTEESILVNFSTANEICHDIVHLSSEYHQNREFKFENLLAVDHRNQCAYFYATSMTADKSVFNSYEDNEYESHLVAIDTKTGKEIDCFTVKGISKITISANGKYFVCTDRGYIRIGLLE